MSSESESNLDLIHKIQDTLTQRFQIYSGIDSEDEYEYDSIEEMWQSEGMLHDNKRSTTKCNNDNDGGENDTKKWYVSSYNYWEEDSSVSPTIDGMLGGFASLTEMDIKGSKEFMDNLISSRPALNKSMKEFTPRCCECGAGIGRVSKGLLLPLGFHCDIVEVSPRLISKAPEFIGEPEASEMCSYITSGLQNFEPAKETYDVIWVQWVIGYLTDWDLVTFLKRMGRALKPGGVIVLKDNTCKKQGFVLDLNDSSVTRSLPYLLALIKETDLKIVSGDGKNMIQKEDYFPDDIFPVPMIALEVSQS